MVGMQTSTSWTRRHFSLANKEHWGTLVAARCSYIPILANPLLEQHHGNSDSVPALGTGMHSSSWTAISQTTATTSSSSFRPPMTGLQFLGNAGDGADEESANAAAFST
jgi:hypothetical protein